MDDRFARLVAGWGVYRASAHTVGGIMLQPLQKQMQRMPRADAAVGATDAIPLSARMHGAIQMTAGHAWGHRTVTRHHTSSALEQTGKHALGDIAGAVPDPGRFV